MHLYEEAQDFSLEIAAGTEDGNDGGTGVYMMHDHRVET